MRPRGPPMGENAIIMDSESRPLAVVFMKKVYSKGIPDKERIERMNMLSRDNDVVSLLGNDAEKIAKLGSETNMSCGLAMMAFKDIKAGNKRDMGILMKFLESISKGNARDFAKEVNQRIMLMDKLDSDERENITKLLKKGIGKVEDETGAAYALGLVISYFDIDLYMFSAEQLAEGKEGRMKQLSKCSEDLDYW
jgi:hypothetical protein